MYPFSHWHVVRGDLLKQILKRPTVPLHTIKKVQVPIKNHAPHQDIIPKSIKYQLEQEKNYNASNEMAQKLGLSDEDLKAVIIKILQ